MPGSNPEPEVGSVPWVGVDIMPSGAGISERLALLAGGALALALVQLLQANLKRNSDDDDSQRTTAHNGKVDMSSYSVPASGYRVPCTRTAVQEQALLYKRSSRRTSASIRTWGFVVHLAWRG